MTGVRAGITNLPSTAFGVGGFTDGVAGAAAAGVVCDGFPKSDGDEAGAAAVVEGAGLLNKENGVLVAGAGCGVCTGDWD